MVVVVVGLATLQELVAVVTQMGLEANAVEKVIVHEVVPPVPKTIVPRVSLPVMEGEVPQALKVGVAVFELAM